MFNTSIAALLKTGIIIVDDVDDGIFDSFTVCDGFSIRAEIEPDTWGEVTRIQRTPDDPDTADHLILIDIVGNRTNTGSSEVMITLHNKVSLEGGCG